MRLIWNSNASASALHAAEAVCRFEQWIADQRTAESIRDYALRLGHWIDRNCGHDVPNTWGTLIAYASEIESNFELASVVCRKRLPGASEAVITQLSGAITDIEAAYRNLFPKLIEQLQLRSRPLQDQWLGFGSGLFAHIGRLTDKELFVPEAKVILVHPVLGGYGYAHLEQNLARIEAVLTNPLVELPEVVRLAWVLAQLQLDLPKHNEFLAPGVLHRIAPLVMLPPVLAAAEVLELSKCDEAMTELAIENWHIPIPAEVESNQNIASVLMDWWETYLQTRPAWPTAMLALSKMLGLQ